MLRDLIKLEHRPEYLTEIVYGWCSVIYEKREHLQDWESPLLVCLEIGFRHLDFRTEFIEAALTHTEHHRGLVDVVFRSQENESIADLLHAWTAKREYYEQGPQDLLDFCPVHLVGLHNLVPFSPRLRRLIIRSVELIGYGGFEGLGMEGLEGEGMEGFEGGGMEGFIGLLNYLHVTVEDMDYTPSWAALLLDTIQYSEGTWNLSHRYWEFLVGFVVSELTASKLTAPKFTTGVDSSGVHNSGVLNFVLSGDAWMRHWDERRTVSGLRLCLKLNPARSLQIVTSLTEAKEWIKLECWVGIVWMLLPEGLDLGEGDLDDSMTLLFRQRPGAVQKLEQWMERWSQRACRDVPESFKQAHKQAHEAAQRDGP